MKLNILFLLLFSIMLNGMDAPLQAQRQFIKVIQEEWQKGWQPQTNAMVIKVTESSESGHRTIILNEEQAKRVADKIKVVLNKRATAATTNKLIVVFVYKGDEPYAKSMASLDAFKKMAYDLAVNRFVVGSEKGRPLASSLATTPSEIELISYAYGSKEEQEINIEEQAKLLDLFIHSLETFNQNKNLKIAFVAAEETAHLVNLMSREGKRNPIDSLIYFQSPIYEWTPGVTGYNYHEAMSPKNFEHLYHIYTKGAPQIAGWSKNSLIYLERKYRQQARAQNGAMVSPVKNIRALKVNEAGQLENFRLEDFFAKNAIKNYGTLFSQADNYQVNSDLIAKVFDQSDAVSSVAVNRFVRLNGNVIEQPMGASLIGSEYYYPVITLKEITLENLRRAFSLEVEESTGQLINITSLAIPEGWFAIRSLIGDVAGDINRIKLMHAKILSSPLYELRIDPNANQFAYLISDKVKAAIKTIAEHSGLSYAFIEGQIKLGAYYMRALLNDQLALIPTLGQEQYLRSIIALVWFLYSQAIENNQLFEEGTFVIEDLGWRVNNFLMNYIQTYGAVYGGAFKDPTKLNSPLTIYNQPLTQTLNDPALHGSFNPYGYPRQSSHYKVSQRNNRHYGIDIRFGNSGELPLLPANKRHILFGKIDQNQQLLFLKPENYGLYFKDGLVYHGKELFESWARKAGWTPTSDDDPSYAKERIPAAFLKDFLQALNETNLPDKIKAEVAILAESDNWGIKILYFDNLLAQPSIAALEKKYAALYRNLRLRSGREVVLSNQDLRTILRMVQAPAAQPAQQLAANGNQPMISKRTRAI